MKVLHIITGLGDGGAEACLYRLIKKSHNQIENIVVSLRAQSKYSDLISELGVQVIHLNMEHFGQIFHRSYKLYSVIKQINPDIVQTWMYHADFLGGVCAKIAKKKVFWGLHNTTLKFGESSTLTICLVRILSKLSFFVPDRIISCSFASTKYHISKGYCRDKMITIHNGIDIEVFRESLELRTQFRKQLSLGNSDFCVGMVARNMPPKDYPTLISALSLLKRSGMNFKCVLVGRETELLSQKIQGLKLENEIIVLGQQDNIPKIMNGLDIFVLSSKAEACPNVLLEAMACGVPCVATNVGDCSYIVDEVGIAVEPENSKDLFEAISHLSLMIGSQLSQNCINKVKNNFSVQQMVDKYVTAWESCVYKS